MVNLDFNYEEDDLELLQEKQEEEEHEEKKKKKRPAFLMIAAIILLLALLGLGGWVVYDKAQKQAKWVNMQMEFDSSKNSLKEEYNTVLQKMDSLSTTGMDLQTELQDKKKQFDNLNSELERVVREKDKDLNAARVKIQELRTQLQQLMEEVEALKRQHDELMARKAAGLLVSPGDTVLVNTRALQFEEVSGKAAVYTSESIRSLKVVQMELIGVAPGGQEKVGALSKFTSGIKVSFMLDKDDAQVNGNRELQLVLSCPGASASESNAAAATATAATAGKDTKPAANSGVNGVQKVYSVKKLVHYDKKKGVKVDNTWTPPTKLNSGDYKVEVFCQGSKLAEKTMYLKKGTKAFPF
ncbi:hypothetical protein SAMN05421788_10293 [Filimonas lacunae]|uniref:Uncharacterized protein n=1 Tax=Filimonas lacunae TaxID=477680 RepID=A0A173MI34_9BACT|nr:hypothetical protein [Filimonas lacunae]BAV07283.1 hypothetical protein FLA_3306 [Filimonas lacunae]SIS92045.1 hypothetical protein SAMN05421788_10293 [Filimonas lacunae]